MFTAAAAATAATGTRAWLATRLRGRKLKLATGTLLATGLVAAGLLG
jgi:hypothetical protein